jgi:hypothetical protein
MISSSEVMTFGNWLGGGNFALGRIEHSEKSATLAPIQIPSQETFNTNIVADFLSFPMVAHAPQSDQ